MLHAIVTYFEMTDNIPLRIGKVALYSHVAKELSKYSTRPNPWTWRYVDGVLVGRVKASKYMQQAIEKLHDEINGKPDIIPVPACPICNQAHTHKHGEQTYDPTTSTLKPLRQPSPPRPARIAIRKDDMSKAARSIVDNISPGLVNQLIVKLLTITNG